MMEKNKKEKVDGSKRPTVEDVLGGESADRNDGVILKMLTWIVFGASVYFFLADNKAACGFFFFSGVALAVQAFSRK